MKKFNFWYKWLLYFSFYIIAFGIVLAFFNQTPLMDFALNDHINPVFWQNTMTLSAKDFQSFIYGVLGATIAGFGVFLAFIVRYPFKNREPWAWYCIGAGLTLWFVIDTYLSIYYGVIFNACFNLNIYLQIIIPLVFTRKYFFDPNI